MKKKLTNAMEVAKLAGVSQSTVSRVFTPGVNVSEQSKKKVLEAAKELGYRPNALARGLIMNKTNMIGIVMGDAQNPFYSEILNKFTKGLQEKGFHVLFFQTKNDELQQEEITQFLEYNVEGVIVTDALLSSNVVSQLSNYNIPVILFNRTIKSSPCHYVCCDNINAGKEIARYLLLKGHREFAYIAGKTNTSTSYDREAGFREVLKENDINLSVENGEYTYQGAYDATLRLLEKEDSPQVIFCANDIMALGAIDGAKSLGVSIPNQLSVIGFDDIAMAAWPPYNLTTWKQPVDEMIEATIRILLHEINDDIKNPMSILLPGELIERQSVSSRKIKG